MTLTSPAGRSPIEAGDNGFWRLRHEDLTAVLARHDLTGGQLRVYLALADLTRGFGRDRDAVSLGQIAQHAGGMRRPHVVRALHALQTKGLYGQAAVRGRAVSRWVTWPPPVPSAENTGGTVPAEGNGTVPTGGNTTVPKGVPTDGNHQDHQELQKQEKRKRAAGRPPPDPRIKVFIDWFCQEYQSVQGRPYIVQGAKDGATVKRLLHALDGDGNDAPGQLRQAAQAMLADSWGRPKADIGLLASKINAWLAVPAQGGQRSQHGDHHYDHGF